MSQDMLKISIIDMSLLITDLSLQPHLPGAKELTNKDKEIDIMDTMHILFTSNTHDRCGLSTTKRTTSIT